MAHRHTHGRQAQKKEQYLDNTTLTFIIFHLSKMLATY